MSLSSNTDPSTCQQYGREDLLLVDHIPGAVIGHKFTCSVHSTLDTWERI